ncbi:MAG: aldehyde dehydrogenase family protein, partial [Chlorobi bacterium]|nr:aldehyde dehydrogenase family protein [Chlorobiota bacterium]
IISPWNYPFLLAMGPLVSAVAAGDSAILKPSEYTPNTLSVLEKIISEIFEPCEAAVVSGGADTGQYLTSLPFDHIFFTGGTEIGKKVMKAAAENLTSVTLELGGKSPAIVDDSANIPNAARKIAWGKLINAGQTCIAPDYLLLSKNIEEQFLAAYKTAVEEIYGGAESFENNVDYCRLIHKNHFERIKSLIDDAVSKGAKTLFPINFNEEKNFFSPNLITNVTWEMKIMREEIFGPLLPMMTYSSFEEIKNIINKNRSPLSLYIFSKKKKFIDVVLKEIPAGSTAVNGTVVQFANGNLPFGGRNGSGMGKAHGYYGFKTFSNEKSSLKQTALSPLKLFYPPYTKTKERLIDFLIKYI